MPLPHPKLKPDAATKLDELLHTIVDKEGVAPLAYLAAANVDEIIYEGQAGNRFYGDDASGKIDAETVVQLFSQTKFVTAIAALRLVERGQASLDDPEVIAKYLPELGKLKVLKGYKDADKPKEEQQPGQEIWEQQKTRITLRMLLTHTSGMGYAFIHPHLMRYNAEHHAKRPGIMMKGSDVDSYLLPLTFQPGSDWSYSLAIDWAGFLVQRITGKTLEEVFQEEIFRPLGLSSLTFYPTEEVHTKLAGWVFRTDKGELKRPPSGMLPMGRVTDAADVKEFSGGAGLFGTGRDYLRFLQAILACSPQHDKEPKHRLISKETYELLFKPTLPIPAELRPPVDPSNKLAAPSAGEDPTLTSLVNFFKYVKDPQPAPTTSSANHSIALAVTLRDSEHGRRAGSASWSGIAKTEYFIDPTTGLAFVCGSQIMVAVNPDRWQREYERLERAMYDALETSCGEKSAL